MIGEIRLYLQTRLKLLKYEAIDTGTSLAAATIVDLTIAFFFLVAFLFLSIAITAFAANILYSWWAGSLAVAAIYVVIAICVPLLRKPLQNVFIRYFLYKFQTHQTMKTKAYLKELGKVIVATFTGFINDNGLKFSAALAYYTVFSLAPLLILVISIASIVFKQDALNNTLYPQIKGYIGADAAAQVQSMVKSLQFSGKTGFALISGIVVLLLGASSIFVEIQDSLNIIWRVKAKPKKGWLKLLQNRFLSFSLILSLGFLLMASLVVNLAINALSDKLAHFLPGVTHLLLNAINLVVTLFVIAVLFAIIFKFLPDVKIKWRDVRSGAVFTAIFFIIGQLLIGLYLSYSAQGSAYGAAGSLIVILVWIYYTSTILYIGAEFTQVYAEARGSVIEPAEFAVHVQQTEIEHEVSTLPPQNPHLQNNLKRK